MVVLGQYDFPDGCLIPAGLLVAVALALALALALELIVSEVVCLLTASLKDTRKADSLCPVTCYSSHLTRFARISDEVTFAAASKLHFDSRNAANDVAGFVQRVSVSFPAKIRGFAYP